MSPELSGLFVTASTSEALPTFELLSDLLKGTFKKAEMGCYFRKKGPMVLSVQSLKGPIACSDFPVPGCHSVPHHPALLLSAY